MLLYRFRYSTNVERVALALAYKGLAVESVEVDPHGDRAEVRELSGQELVPVLVDDDGTVVHDSMEIVRHLEERHPEPPLYPRDPARRAELRVFVDWFNRVWKRPPNAIEGELRRREPDRHLIGELAREMVAALDLFEALLDGREHLMGDFSAADVAAFPFLKYAALPIEPDDDWLFHEVLRDYQPLGAGHPRLEAWIRRVDGRPRA